MFALLDRPALGELTDAALIDTLEHHTRAEAIEAAARLAVIAEITARHCDDEDDASALLAIDGWEIAAAAVSAACNLSRKSASAQMRIAQALCERLPKVAATFARGDISAKVVSTITWRTQNINDDEALALVDAALAGAATTYGALSATKTEQAIDVWVEKFDPAAVRRTRTAARERDIHFGDPDDPNGTVSIWGRLLATDAALLKQLLNTMARGVCDNDPRTLGQRRSDALGSIGAGADHLTCQCGSPDCAATGVDPRSRAVVVHLLAQLVPQSATSTETPEDEPAETTPTPEHPRDPRIHGESDYRDLADDREPAVTGGPAVILGGGIVPAPLLAELIATGATVKHVTDPEDLTAQTTYRPSTKLAAFVRMRDLVCMFPGCGVAAHNCDLDHSTPGHKAPPIPATWVRNAEITTSSRHSTPVRTAGRTSNSSTAATSGTHPRATPTAPPRSARSCFPTGPPTPQLLQHHRHPRPPPTAT